MLAVRFVTAGHRDPLMMTPRMETMQAFCAAEAGTNMVVRAFMVDADGDGVVRSVLNDDSEAKDPAIGAAICVSKVTRVSETSVTSTGRCQIGASDLLQAAAIPGAYHLAALCEPPNNRVDDILRMLNQAFEGVTRVGGRSWTDAIALDLMGVPGKDFAVTHRDDDRSWWDVVRDPCWDPDSGMGGWAFLDGIGFRYYLAAAMGRVLDGGEVGSLAWQFRRPSKGASRRRFDDRWILDPAQHEVAMRFAAFMLERAFRAGDQAVYDEWDAAISSWASD